jgi:DNA-directed RNA polymerase sigma subunit (sigma70/sigma32)
MDSSFSARMSLLLEDAKFIGFVDYGDLGHLFPASGVTQPELDHLLSQLDRSGIEIVPRFNKVPPEDSAIRISAPASEAIGDDHPLQVYRREVAKVPPLSPQREAHLAKAIAAAKNDSAEEKKQLVEANLGLVVSISQRSGRSETQMLDLIVKGNAGLINAAGTFRPGNGYKFSTYAAFCVSHCLSDHDFPNAK